MMKRIVYELNPPFSEEMTFLWVFFFPRGRIKGRKPAWVHNLPVASLSLSGLKDCGSRLGENLKDAVYPMSQT